MKKIPTEVLFHLDQQLIHLPTSGTARRILIQEASQKFNISESSVYRQLNALHLHVSERKHRSDKGKSRILPEKKLYFYCQIIAALKFASLNGNGHILSTDECIKRLEAGEVTLKGQQIIVKSGILRRSTINDYLKKYYISPDQINYEPTVNHFQALYSNQCWQLDITPSELYRLPNQHPDDPRKVMMFSVIDDFSRIGYAKYYLSEGEDVLTVLDFLYHAFAKITSYRTELYGIPDFLYVDNGSFRKSQLLLRVIEKFGSMVLSHLPKGKGGRKTTARSKGKIERHHRTIKSGLEPLYKFRAPKSLEEANELLAEFMEVSNNKKHPMLDLSKYQAWHLNLPKNHDMTVCTYKHFQSLIREPFCRRVKSDATVQVNNTHYQLASQLAGEEVIVLIGPNINEVYVEYRDEELGPFYPVVLPSEFGKYRHHKKSEKEHAADNVITLSKSIGLNFTSPTNKIYKNAQNIGEKFAKKQKVYETKLEAKLAVSNHLGIPLAELSDKQREIIDKLTEKTLKHNDLMDAIDHYFQLKLVSDKE